MHDHIGHTPRCRILNKSTGLWWLSSQRTSSGQTRSKVYERRMTLYELKLVRGDEWIVVGPFVNIDRLGNGNHPICSDIDSGMYGSREW